MEKTRKDHRQLPSPWQMASGAVLGYEGLAAMSKAGKHHKLLPFELPFLTEMIRPLPKPVRVVVTFLIGVVVYDHFNEEGLVFCKKDIRMILRKVEEEL